MTSDGSMTREQRKLAYQRYEDVGPGIDMIRPPEIVFLPGPMLMPFSVDRVMLGQPERQITYGGSKVSVMFAANPTRIEPLRFQTPPMCVSNGLNKFTNARGESSVIELDFAHRPCLKAQDDFFKCLRQLDQKILATMITQRSTWVPAIKSRIADADLCYNFLGTTRPRESKDGKVTYEPRINLKIWKTSELYRKGCRDPIAFTKDNVPKECWVICIIMCTGVWISKDSVSVAWSLDQALLVDAPDLDSSLIIQPTSAGPMFVGEDV